MVTKKTIKKKIKDEMFIQIGMRRNGRVVKAENYKVIDFIKKLFDLESNVKVPKAMERPKEVKLIHLNIWKFLFSPKKRQEAEWNRQQYERYKEDLEEYRLNNLEIEQIKFINSIGDAQLNSLKNKVVCLIEQDNFGKKKK